MWREYRLLCGWRLHCIVSKLCETRSFAVVGNEAETLSFLITVLGGDTVFLRVVFFGVDIHRLLPTHASTITLTAVIGQTVPDP